jgi:hypothetical protein
MIFSLRAILFSRKARSGILLREFGLRPMLRLQDEGGIETNSFPHSALHLPPSRFAQKSHPLLYNGWPGKKKSLLTDC